MGKVKVKILGISCGHRKGRNTAWLTLFALKAAEKFGRRIGDLAEIDIELIDLSDVKKNIPATSDCKIVNGHYECSTSDYITDVVMPKMVEADAYIFGSPVFTGSYTSKFISLFERMRAGIREGYFTNKPAGSVTVATMAIGGQERCLEYMDMCIRAVGMIPAHWLSGCSGVSGIPYGPLAGDDTKREIAVQKDRYAQWTAIHTGRRVAEMAVVQKVAKRRLGDLYSSEFIQSYNLPFGKESWAWNELDKAGQNFMGGLDGDKLKELDKTVLNKPAGSGDGAVTCKILGLGCDDYKGIDTNWLIVNSLKAAEKFGSKVESVGNFETEFIDLADKKIKRCRNCDERYEIPHGSKRWKGTEYPSPDTYGCILKNDFFSDEILPRLAEVDGIIMGSSVCALTPSVVYRLFAERVAGAIWFGWTTMKPTANIAVSYDNTAGQESCLNIMNTCNRWVEYVPVAWPHGTGATGGPLDTKEILVKNDPMACNLSIINGRRVAEFALMNKLAKQEIEEAIYKSEFYHVIHPPHGEASWEWSRLDKEEEEYMFNMTSDALEELGR
jgi:multimeric flavodoxin WrbA